MRHTRHCKLGFFKVSQGCGNVDILLYTATRDTLMAKQKTPKARRKAAPRRTETARISAVVKLCQEIQPIVAWADLLNRSPVDFGCVVSDSVNTFCVSRRYPTGHANVE